MTTFTVFISSLRFLVLFGLFLASSVNAAGICQLGGYTGSAASVCSQFVANQNVVNSGWGWKVDSFSPTQCKYSNSTGAYAYTETISCGCATSPVDRQHTIKHNGLPQPDFRWTNWSPQPNTCNDSCVENFDPVATRNRVTVQPGQTPLYTGSDPSRQEFVCNTLPAGANANYCTGVWNPTGSVCISECPSGTYKSGNSCITLPTCTPPQQLNQQNVCETPACPAGQVRETSLGACKPIVCTAPLIKVGNTCELPKCPAGQTYKYENGAGSCIKDTPVCNPPMVLVDGICKVPTCPTGMILDSVTGSCIRNPDTNPTPTPTPTPTPDPNSPTVTNPVPTPSPTPTPTPTPAPNPAGGGGGTPSGNATNTGGSGTCTQAPCGNCDPTKETCGNTFGGSCKSDFKCNGDAIQCAVALATNKSECELQSIMVDTEKDNAYLEGKAIADAGTKALGTDGGIPVTNGGSISINTTNPFGQSCPADYQMFQWRGTNYAFPFSKFCGSLTLMGLAVLVIASLISMKIIMKTDS